MPKKKSTKKSAAARKSAKKKTTRKPAARKQAKKAPEKKKAAKKKATTKKKTQPARKKPVSRSEHAPKKTVRKRKGVRRATTTSGVSSAKSGRRLGRSQIPIDAPLDIVFQNDQSAREAFVFLGIHTVRELEQFEPDELVRRLTSPAKQTVGRIRKILAMNNRSLEKDEAFAMEFKERLSQTHAMRSN